MRRSRYSVLKAKRRSTSLRSKKTLLKNSLKKRVRKSPSRKKYSKKRSVPTKKQLIVYTLEGCPACVMTINLCNERGVSYEHKDIIECSQEVEKYKPGNNHAPAIFLKKGMKYINGYSELLQLIDSKQL